MTAKQLINKLQKLPPSLRVLTANHDNDEYEFSGGVGRVDLVDFADEDNHTFTRGMNERVIIIRP